MTTNKEVSVATTNEKARQSKALAMDGWTSPDELNQVAARRLRARGGKGARQDQSIAAIQPTEYSVRDDLMRAGLMFAAEACDEAAGQGGGSGEPSVAADLFGNNQGFDVIHLPPDLFGADVQRFAGQIVRSVYALEPPRNQLMAAVYRMLTSLADRRIYPGIKGVTVGLLLGAAKVHGIKIKTHPRDLAKEIGIKYATLLAVRKATIHELGQISPDPDNREPILEWEVGDPFEDSPH